MGIYILFLGAGSSLGPLCAGYIAEGQAHALKSERGKELMYTDSWWLALGRVDYSHCIGYQPACYCPPRPGDSFRAQLRREHPSLRSWSRFCAPFDNRR